MVLELFSIVPFRVATVALHDCSIKTGLHLAWHSEPAFKPIVPAVTYYFEFMADLLSFRYEIMVKFSTQRQNNGLNGFRLESTHVPIFLNAIVWSSVSFHFTSHNRGVLFIQNMHSSDQ